MMKRMPVLLAVVLVLGAEPPANTAKEELSKMQGEWTVEKAQRGGMAATDDELKKMRVKISGTRVTIDVGEARDEVAQMMLDPNQKPAAVDITPRDKEPMKGI